MGYSFPKTDRILRRDEFLTVQKRGRRVHTRHFVVVVFDRGDGGDARLGLVTSRKVANAVGRNRVRRRVREVFRRHRERFPVGHDVVVIARERASGLDSAAVCGEILGAFVHGGTSRSRATVRRTT